jgi:hypothetical protein
MLNPSIDRTSRDIIAATLLLCFLASHSTPIDGAGGLVHIAGVLS